MKNPCRLVAAVATLCLFAGVAIAQTPTKAMKAPTGNGNGGGAGTVGNILCDDPCNNAQYGFASQCFSDFPSFSSQTWDDCGVPDGAVWVVDGLCFDGFYNYSPHCPAGYKFKITRDAGGLPDCANPCLNIEVPGPDPSIDTPDCLGLPDGKFCYCPGGLKTLDAGCWWFGAAVNMHFASPSFCGQWYWTGSTTPHRRKNCPYLDNPGGGFGLPPCANWCTVLGIDQDLAFTVYGTEISACNCALRAGNVDTNGGTGPVDVISISASRDVGDSCRALTISAGATTINVDKAPSNGAKGQYGLWIMDGNNCDGSVIQVHKNSNNTDVVLGNGPNCLPVSNTVSAGSCPCPVGFPTGRTSKSLGGGVAALVCLNKKPGFGKSPITFAQTFPAGSFQVMALVLDFNAPAAPAKNIAVGNSIALTVL
jgi:hypothetical protein